MDISFIIPVFNTEYVKMDRCIRSIQNLSNVDFECIVIDDGSEENNSELYKVLLEKDTRFKYFKKENEGVSAARNFGITKACGDYIFFVDSDDELLADGVMQVYASIIKTGQYDLVISNLEVVESKKTTLMTRFQENSSISYVDVLRKMTRNGNLNGPYAKFIRRHFLISNNILFNTTMISGEDALFQLTMLEKNPKMYSTNIATYRYHRFQEPGKNRVWRFPEVCLDNRILQHEKVVDLIRIGQLSEKEQNELIVQQYNLYLTGLFSWMLEVAEAGLLDRYLKERLFNAMNELAVNEMHSCKLACRLRYDIMRSRSDLLINFFMHIRKYYQKIKHWKSKFNKYGEPI